MLGHANITSYVDFTQRLIDRFYQKEPDIHFRELIQLKHSRSQEEYIAKFEWTAVMVTDIVEERLIMLFIEGLTKPLQG